MSFNLQCFYLPGVIAMGGVAKFYSPLQTTVRGFSSSARVRPVPVRGSCLEGNTPPPRVPRRRPTGARSPRWARPSAERRLDHHLCQRKLRPRSSMVCGGLPRGVPHLRPFVTRRGEERRKPTGGRHTRRQRPVRKAHHRYPALRPPANTATQTRCVTPPLKRFCSTK